ncbi:MAG: TonB-dependent receptor [Bacteroidales bacterium]|nr:TonB-dependent receptor [Bacteroidales bacterium]
MLRLNGQQDVMVANADQELQRFTGYNQMNVMQKFRYRPLDWLDLTYGFHYLETSDVPRYDRLLQYQNPDTLKYASWYYGPQKWMLNVLNSSIMVNCRMITELKVTLAWQKFEESRHSRKFANNWFKNQYEDLDMYTANIDIEKRLDEKNSFFYGFEGVYNDIRSSAYSRDYVSGETKKTGTRYPDGTNDYSTYAGYLNYERRFSRELTLFAGFRYSHVNLKSTFSDTSLYHFPFDEIRINTGALNGSAGVSWRPADVWQLRLNLSSGFRAPNLDDAGKVFDSSPGNVVVPNPGLKPEYAYNLDAGIQRTIGDIAVLELSAFYTYLLDAMVRRDFTFNGQDSIWYDGELSKVEAIVNAGSAQIYGLSAMGILDMGEHFKLKSTITWTQGEDNEGYAMRHVSPLFGNTSLIYNNDRFLAELYANYNGSIPYSRLAPSEREKPHIYATDSDGNPYSPSWWTINFKASYRIIDQLSLDLGIENIFDERYRSYSSGIVSPGRNFIIAVRATL